MKMSRQRANLEGSIYQRRSDGRWVAAISIGDGKRKTAVAPTQAAAKRRLEELRDVADQGLSFGTDPTVADYLRRWLKESAPRTLRPRTLAGYTSIVERGLIPRLGHLRLRKLHPSDIDGYLIRIEEIGLSARTGQYHHAVLRRALGQAEKWGLVPRNVAKLVTPPQVRRREVAPLTPDQARQFLAGIEGDRLAALYGVSLSLGLRQGEALGLQWAGVNFQRGTLTVEHTLQRYGGAYHLDEPKTERSRRTINLPSSVAESLRHHRIQQAEGRVALGPAWVGAKWDLVFCNEVGEPLDGTAVTRAFQKKLAELGLPRQRFHDLRHAAGSFMLAQGASLREVMEVLGHSSIQTTADIYLHILPQLKKETADRMEALLYG